MKKFTIPRNVENMVKRCIAGFGGIHDAQTILLAAQEEGLVSNEEANHISDEYGLGLSWESEVIR